MGCKTWGTQAKFRRRSSGKRLAQHSFEKNHCVVWKEARVLEVEINSVYRKYKEAAYLSCLQNPIDKSSTEISPI
jgi:hypothetical protein